MKKLTVTIMALMFIPLISAFSQVIKEEMIEFNKKMVPAVSLEISDMDAPTASSAFQLFLKNHGLQGKKMKNFFVYLNQPLAKISSETLDIYTAVLSKGSKKVAKTYVYFFHSKGNENFVDANSNPAEIENVKALLKEFVNFSTEYAFTMKVNAKKEQIAMLEKDLAALKKSMDKERKKKEKIDKKLSTLQEDVDKKTNALINTNSELNILQSQGK